MDKDPRVCGKASMRCLIRSARGFSCVRMTEGEALLHLTGKSVNLKGFYSLPLTDMKGAKGIDRMVYK